MMSVPRTVWDDYWSRIWSVVWNVIGIITLVITFVGICGFITYAVYDAFQPPSRSKSSPLAREKLSYSERLSLQSAFNVLLATEKTPCAIKGKGEQYSDVSRCSLFRIALGAYDGTVALEIDKSGYFPGKSAIYDACNKEDCAYQKWVSNTREGFSISVSLNYTTDSTLLRATEVHLSFDAGTHPYFDAQTIRSAFVKLIGPPDHTSGDTDSWGPYGSANIWANITKDKGYSITLQDRSKIKRKETDKAKKEGDKK